MSGLSPEDLFDEAVANMICDGVEDLRNGCVKIYYEQDEAKKVNSKCCKVLFCSSHETNDFLPLSFSLHAGGWMVEKKNRIRNEVAIMDSRG